MGIVLTESAGQKSASPQQTTPNIETTTNNGKFLVLHALFTSCAVWCNLAKNVYAKLRMLAVDYVFYACIRKVAQNGN